MRAEALTVSPPTTAVAAPPAELAVIWLFATTELKLPVDEGRNSAPVVGSPPPTATALPGSEAATRFPTTRDAVRRIVPLVEKIPPPSATVVPDARLFWT